MLVFFATQHYFAPKNQINKQTQIGSTTKETDKEIVSNDINSSLKNLYYDSMGNNLACKAVSIDNNMFLLPKDENLPAKLFVKSGDGGFTEISKKGI